MHGGNGNGKGTKRDVGGGGWEKDGKSIASSGLWAAGLQEG
jgi:hypothetical protein